MMIFLPLAQGASSKASGTRVVLPAPGGATSTAALLLSSVRESSSSTASIGSGVSKDRGKVCSLVMPGLDPGIHVFLQPSRKQDVDGRDKHGHDGISNSINSAAAASARRSHRQNRAPPSLRGGKY